MSSDLPLGEVIYIAVKPIFKIYFIIATGFVLARKNILTVETSKDISTIAIKVLIPCLTFDKIVTNINNSLIHEISTIVFIAYFMMFSQALVIFLVGVAVGCPRNWWGGLILCGLLPNISDLPIAYLQTMETANIFENVDLGVSFVMIYMGLQLILQFTLGSYKLIEYDFKVDLRMALENGKNGDIEEGGNCEEPSNDLTSLSSNSKSMPQSDKGGNIAAQHSVTDYKPENLRNEPSGSNLHDISDSIISASISSLRAEPLPDNLDTDKIRKTTTNTSKRHLTRHTSRVSIPGNMLHNAQTGLEPEGIEDIIRVYSRYDQLVEEQDISLLENDKKTIKKKNAFQKMIFAIKSIDWKDFFNSMIEIWKDSFTQPASVVLVLSITVCMIPWVQALFVDSTQAQLPSAPDKQPPLSFVMDYTSYIGAAQVPFGLLLLGGTIGRLKINDIPIILWRIPIAVTFLRLFIFPIIGCAFNSKIYRDGLFYSNDILYFLSNINFCLPPATSLLYITAFYTPLDGKNHIQMDMLALVYIFHYIFLAICLPFTATYTMKVSLGY